MAWRTSRLAKMVGFSSVAKSGSGRHKQPYRTRLLLELLEDRCVPTTIMPTTYADGVLGSGSLRAAVLQFNADSGTDDDTILLEAGTYALTIPNIGGHHETAGLTGDLNLTSTSHRWIIQGAGPSTFMDASQLQDRAFQIVNPGTQVVFQDLVIQGGLAQDNGSNGALAGTTDALGGGILNNGGNITLDHVVLTNNVARGGDAAVRAAPGHNARGGGFYSAGGALTIAGATIANNWVIGGRGGDYIYTYGADGGSAAGGGLYATGGSLEISDSMIASNRATGGPGGIGLSTRTTSGTYYHGGSGGVGQGGGLYVNGGSLTIATSTITSNQGTGGSGAAGGADGGGEGGGLYNGGTLTVSNSTLSGNIAAGGNSGSSGGGIYSSGTLTVRNSTLSGNSATYGGGGIYSSGTLTVSNSTLSGNSATGDFSYGGGISNTGTLTVSNSTLSGNTTSGGYYGFGGGIVNGGTLTVSNSTLSGNSATGDFSYGGGIYTESGTRPVTLTNVTLTANRANTGGGLRVDFGSPVLHNTLIGGNFRGATGTTRDDVSGTLNPSGDYNLIGDGTGMIGLSNGVNGNLVGSATAPIDPLLGPLQDNGGPTKTHALLAGSPALNTGDPNQLGVADQRGVARAGGVNIGAYQASASAFVVTVSGTVTPGTPFDVTVQAVDIFGQVAFGYRGTVTFSVTDPDPAVVLPADYAFTADDPGMHAFTGGFTLITPGPWTLTVADLANGLSIGVTLTVYIF
jgi:predicted outer membrane repeat protein